MSHSYNKSDGTFPHKKDGGVLGNQNPAGYNRKMAKSKALKKISSYIGIGKSHERWSEALKDFKDNPPKMKKLSDGSGYTSK